MLDLPRSVRLAAWGTAVLTGSADLETAVRAVTGDDEPHRVSYADHDVDTAALGADLAVALGGFLDAQVPGLRVTLPVPGDVLGLPGPPAFNRVALAAGECVLTDPVRSGWAAEAGLNPSAGMVPQITTFGSEWEPGVMVTWQLYAVEPRRLTVVGSLGDAERELKEALITATEALSRLDVARWRDDAAHRIAAVRDGGLPRGALPPSAPGRCVRVLGAAARVRAIIELAAEDEGAAVSSHEMERRARTLRELDGVCRRAMTAAVAGLREPTR